MSAAFEVGLNSPANAAQVGGEAYKAAKAWVTPDPSAPGSTQNIKSAESQLQKAAKMISDNTNLAGYDTGAHKADLQALTETLIGANMDALNGEIQDALRALRSSNPDYYDPTTVDGIKHLQELQALATDENLASKLADPDGPFGAARHADRAAQGLGDDLSSEEIEVINKIQMRNLASAAQNLNTQYDAAGSRDAKTDVGNFIDGL